MIIDFHSSQANLENSGGKGANLVRLSRAGFEVPPGFIISTSAYRKFLQKNSLKPLLRNLLSGLSADAGAHDFEKASQMVRKAFQKAQMPHDIEEKILKSYEKLATTPGEKNRFPVAVRSSATTEDLPELSFAGQQETFLNVTTKRTLMRAVIGCWSSLFTARAISYRLNNHVPGDDLALAVVVQRMVNAEASGVIFTANPLTGQRNEIVINSTFGLGEALVSGQVDPDQFIVNSVTGECISKQAGAKETITRSKSGGGVEHQKIKQPKQKKTGGKAQKKWSLRADQISKLSETATLIEKEYNSPQDIEWAIYEGNIFILQSRPVTSLFPVPLVSYDPLQLWISFGAVQGYLGPMTTLGRDVIKHLFLGAASVFNVKPRYEDFHIVSDAAERLWVKVSDLLHYRLPYRVFTRFIEVADPQARQIIFSLKDDPKLQLGKARIKLKVLPKVLHFAMPVMHRFIRNMISPTHAREKFEKMIAKRLASIQIPESNDPYEQLSQVIKIFQKELGKAFPILLPRFVPVMGPAMASLYLINHFVGDMNQAMKLTRGLPHNVTTEMDLALWKASIAILEDTASAKRFQNSPPEALARDFLKGALPGTAQHQVDLFLRKYGMRGIGEIDFGQRRWRENPSEVIHTIQSYLEIDPALAPDVLFSKSASQAQEAMEQACTLVRSQKAGRLKEKIVRAAARRIRLLMGARESPKFYIIRIMGLARSALLDVGRKLAQQKLIDHPEDLVFLKFHELETLANEKNCEKWRALIAQRKTANLNETRRRQIPRVLLSDGRAIFEGIGNNTNKNVITGSPVSPGVVEGVVHVVLDPRKSRLAPGEILVCHGTDPAWTPLFMAAGGLITEAGGMMTHGSVVAREYGIPAVVGVQNATTLLKSGQKIQIDGSSGKIVILKR